MYFAAILLTLILALMLTLIFEMFRVFFYFVTVFRTPLTFSTNPNVKFGDEVCTVLLPFIRTHGSLGTQENYHRWGILSRSMCRPC